MNNIFGDNKSSSFNDSFQKKDENFEYKSKDLIYLQSLVGENSVAGGYYIKFCKILKEAGVPTSRLPSMGHFLSRMFDSLDENKINNWITRYVDLEKLDIVDEDSKEE